MKKLKILVTAGPTRERIDPVRFISNYSTGTFGYEIAKEAARRCADVVLISGPTALVPPKGVRFIPVESALEMGKVVEKEFGSCDCLIMAAAVSDWRVRAPKSAKIKRGGRMAKIELVENPDILARLGRKKGKRVLVGFALETASLEANALKKLKKKNLDIIVANKLTKKSGAFGDITTDILIIDKTGKKTFARRRSKWELAKIIINQALQLLNSRLS